MLKFYEDREAHSPRDGASITGVLNKFLMLPRALLNLLVLSHDTQLMI